MNKRLHETYTHQWHASPISVTSLIFTSM